MTNRELLTLAAKAAGIEVTEWSEEAQWYWTRDWHWNPLTSDADALRLAVKLGLTIVVESDSEKGKDPYAATRRAIVRAAAEIGRTM